MSPILACWLATLVSLAPVPDDLCLGKDPSTGRDRPCQSAVTKLVDDAPHCLRCLTTESHDEVARVPLVAE